MALAARILSFDRVVALAVALVAFGRALATPADFDYWWHLAAGRYMVQTGQWPSPDPFSATAAGEIWTVHEAALEVVMYWLYAAVGHLGPAAFFATCFTAAMLIAFELLRRTGMRVALAALLSLLLIVGCLPFVGPRPHVVSLLLFTLTWTVVLRWMRERDRSVWAIPVLFLVWANLHGGFMLGLVVPVLLLADDVVARWGWRDAPGLGARDRRRLSLAVGLAVAALFCSPNGWHLVAYPFTALGRADVRSIAEWAPASIHASYSWGFFPLAGVYLLLGLLRRPRLAPFDVLAAGAFLLGGLWGVRIIPFASIALVVLIARALQQPCDPIVTWPASRWWRGTEPSRSGATRPRRVALSIAILLVAAVPVIPQLRTPTDPAASVTLPTRAVAEVGSAGLRPPLLNEYAWGGYLIWTLWPDSRVFIDGRSHDLYTHGTVFPDYLRMANMSPGAERLVEQYGIETVLFPRDAILPRYLIATGAWETTYEDDFAVVLRRR